nr:hypothetical protein [Tanacetum cinerariifolium]
MGIKGIAKVAKGWFLGCDLSLDCRRGFQDIFDAEKIEEESDQQYVLFLVWSSGFTNPQNNNGDAAFDEKEPEFEGSKPESEVHVSPSSSAYTNTFSAAGPSNAAASPTKGKSLCIDASQLLDDPDMLELEDITYFDDEDDVGAEADFNNLKTSITISPIPTTRVHTDHPMTQIIGDLSLASQTRSMTRVAKDQGGLSQMFNDDFHTCMFACFLSQEEPKRVHQALKDPSWIEAMQDELLQFKMQKEEGINYEKVFAPVARIEAIRLFLAYAFFMGFMVYQMDVKSAFLYGTIKEEVYVCQPLGFKDPDYLDKVYNVVKALYGLHQAPKAWYETLANYLLENGFERGKIDQTLFIKRQKSDILLVQIYKKDWIFISQDKYVDDILRKFRLTDGKSDSTPIDTEKPLLKDPDGEDVNVHTYRSIIVSLMYLTSSRPDIMFAVVLSAMESLKRMLHVTNILSAGLLTSQQMVLNSPCLTHIKNWLVQIKWSLFWTTVAVKKVNDITRLQAPVDKKKVVVTEATIRDALCLDNAEGVECLPNEGIFVKLARMGYEKPSTKLTWFSGVETPLFEGILVAQEIGEGVADEVYDEGVPAASVATEGVVSAADDVVLIVDKEHLFHPLHHLLYQHNHLVISLLLSKIDTSDDTVMDDISNQGRRIADMDIDTDVVLEEAKDVAEDAKDGQDADVQVNADIQERTAKSQAEIYKIDLDPANKVLSMKEEESKPAKLKEVVDIVTTAKIITEVVTAASTTITTANVPIPAATTAAALTLTAAPSRRTKGVVIKDPEESTTTTSTIIHSEAKSKDKGKRILERNLNLSRSKPKLNKMKNMLETQARKNMMIYLKNVAGFKMDYFKGMSYDDISPIFEAKFDSNMAFLQKTKEQIDEEESKALKRINETPAEKAVKRKKLDEEPWTVASRTSREPRTSQGRERAKSTAEVMVIDKSWTSLGKREKAFYTGLKKFVNDCKSLVDSAGNIRSLYIDGQSIDVDAPPDIIDVVDEDDDIIDEEGPIPYDLVDSKDEDLVNLDINDGINMSADVARCHDGKGTRKPNLGGRRAGRLHTLQETQNLRLKAIMDKSGPVSIRFEFGDRETQMPLKWKAGVMAKSGTQFDLHPHMESDRWPQIHVAIQQHLQKLYNGKKAALKEMHWVPEEDGTYNVERIRRGRPLHIFEVDWDGQIAFWNDPKKLAWAAQNKQNRAKSKMESSATREYPSLIHTFFLTHTVGGVFLNPVDKTLYDEMLRLQGLGFNTPSGVPYIEDEIMVIVYGGKQRGHIPGVGRVLPGLGMAIPSLPPYTHSFDVAKLKNREKLLIKKMNMFMKLFRSDDKFSQMLTQLESQPEYDGGSESGGYGDNEPGDDEDDGEDEDDS